MMSSDNVYWPAAAAFGGDSTEDPAVDADALASLFDRLAAAGREDRPPRYREKHLDGRTT